MSEAFIKTAAGWVPLQTGPSGPPGVLQVYEQINDPGAVPVGSVWIDTDAPDPAPIPARATVRQSHTWTVEGPLTAKTLPGFFASLSATQTGKIVGMRGKIQSGTSISARITKNGSNIGFALTVQQTPSTTTWTPVTIVNEDDIGLVLSSPNSSPVGLQLTVFEEYIIAES